jgi:hypothetical protein
MPAALKDNDGLDETLDGLALQQQTERRIKAGRRALADLVTRLNLRYAVVNENGKAVVYEQRIDPVLKRKLLVRLEFEALKKLYMNKRLTVVFKNPQGKPGLRTVTKSEAQWWLESEDRRQYLDGVVFDPTDSAPPTCWNLWSGFAVEPESGNWSLMQNHILDVLADGNQERAVYIVNWTAWMFQNMATQGKVALILRGGKGAGKGIFFVYLLRAFGQHGIYISNAKHLVGNFNAHLRDCVFLFADEAFFAGDRQHESVLKSIITEPVLTIEGKYLNTVNAPNRLHIGIASNADWVVPASLDERRYAVFKAAEHRIGNRPYFKALAMQMNTGGLAAMIYDLLHRDLTGFEIEDVPYTEALASQKRHSLNSLHRWWCTVLDRGFLYKSKHGVSWFQQWHNSYTTELLFGSYLQWCHATHPRDRMTREQLGTMMAGLYTADRSRASRPLYEIESIDRELLAFGKDPAPACIVFGERKPGYTVGDLECAQARYTEVTGVALGVHGGGQGARDGDEEQWTN